MARYERGRAPFGYDAGWRRYGSDLRHDESSRRWPGYTTDHRDWQPDWYPSASSSYRGDRLPRMSRDEAIRAAVRTTLFEDTWLDARDVRVEVDDGIVTLEGEVRTHLEARYAWDDAWETEGVRGVKSRLEVRERQE